MKQLILAVWRFLDCDHRLLFKRQLKHDNITIVGGYCGLMAEKYGSEGINVTVYEPIKQYAKAIKERCKRLPVIVKPYGLGYDNRVVDFSLISGDSRELGPEGLYDCNDFIEKCRIKDCAKELKSADGLLYLNCEGAEYDIIERLYKRNMLEQFDTILIQFHATNSGSVRNCLLPTHKIVWTFPNVWEEWKRKRS